MEKLQQDSDKSLAQHKQELMGELAAEKDGAAPGAADPNQGLTEAMLSAVASPAVSIAIAVADDLASTNKKSSNIFTNTKSKHQNSLFVGGGGGATEAKSHRTTPLVPMSYSDKKVAMKNAPSKRDRDGDIFARTRVSSMSLTGATILGGKSTAIKGVSTKASDAKAIKIKELQAELAVVNRVMDKPYEGGNKRLESDLKKGVDSAEVTVQRSAPEKVKSVIPQSMMHMKPSGSP
jgi:hypothetical protein